MANHFMHVFAFGLGTADAVPCCHVDKLVLAMAWWCHVGP